MIHVWDYSPGERVKVVCCDEEILEGVLTSIDDEEESGLEECGISVFTTDGRYIGIGQSEIKRIDVLEHTP